MFCRNCGAQYPSDQAVVCVKCGTPKGMGTAFCPYCGSPTHPAQAVCTNCGCGLTLNAAANPNAKSKMVAGLLGIFLGMWGVHNFYLGYTNKALIQLIAGIVCFILGFFTCGLTDLIWIWGLVEGIMILTGSISKDGQGNPLKD